MQEVSDSSGSTGLSLYGEMRALRVEMYDGFDRLDRRIIKEMGGLRSEFKKEIVGLRKSMDKGHKETNQRLDQHDKQFGKMVGLLEMIAENTKK